MILSLASILAESHENVHVSDSLLMINGEWVITCNLVGHVKIENILNGTGKENVGHLTLGPQKLADSALDIMAR